MAERRKRKWIPKANFFREHDMRTLMSHMYLALTEKENVDAIVNLEPDEIRKLKAGSGRDSVREAIRSFRYVLEYYKDISDSKDSFVGNVLSPIKFSAQFVSKMKSQPGGKKTTDLQCLVFAKSLPYDDQYNPGEKQVTVSTICPKLRTTMSVRISEREANKIDYKVYKFPNVQPIPLANRMRSWAGRNGKVEDTSLVADLSAYDFLFADIDDIIDGYYKYSFEMQHYCEISADKSGLNQMLGATLVCSGKLLGISGQTAFITNPLTGYEQEFHIRTKKVGAELIEKVDLLTGKQVRILCSVWYSSEGEREEHPSLPEIFMIEQVDSEEQSILENIIGHVRIRRSVKKEELESLTGNLKHFVNSTNCLEFDNGNVIYKETSLSNDDIPNEYLAVSNGIRRVRLRDTSSPSPLLIPDDFLDDANLEPAQMVRKPYVAETILNAIWDEEQLTGQNIVTFRCPVYEERSNIKRFMRQHELAEFTEKKNEMQLTRRGRRLGDIAVGDIIDDTLDELDANRAFCIYDKKIRDDFFIDDSVQDLIPKYYRVIVPTKMILKTLGNNRERFVPIFDGSKFFWMQTGADQKKLQKECIDMLKNIFETKWSKEMYQKPHSMSVFDQYLDYADSIVMREFEKCFEILNLVDVKTDRTGTKRWELSNNMRVLWLLSNNGGRLAESEIIRMAKDLEFTVRDGNNMLTAERLAALDSTLAKLKSENKISGSKGGYWELSDNALQF